MLTTIESGYDNSVVKFDEELPDTQSKEFCPLQESVTTKGIKLSRCWELGC